MRRIIEDIEEKEKNIIKEYKKICDEIDNLSGIKSVLNPVKLKKLNKKKNSLILELIDIKDKKWDLLSNNHFTTQFKSIAWQIDRLSETYEDVRTILLEFIELRESIKKLSGVLNRKELLNKDNELKKIYTALDTISYLSFERRFRKEDGLYDIFKKYIDYFPEKALVVDLGCGRGEFLEFLEQSGRFGIGVDLNEGMLNLAKRKGLKVFRKDIIEFLSEKEDDSFEGIFSSQVIEHLKYEDIEKLVNSIYKKLKKGGVAILEAVNPLSWFGFSQVFLLDPTHISPLHPELMRYLFQSFGFSDINIIYSGEPDVKLKETRKDLPAINYNFDLLNKHLFSSVNYAIKGVKS
jgi:O-antigen chain-terminating methyltransferase